VALPTGLGKTFIAAVVMYNYFRWFPEGKVWAQTGKRYLLSLTDTFENLR
jgi:ERCC4-related helicase